MLNTEALLLPLLSPRLAASHCCCKGHFCFSLSRRDPECHPALRAMPGRLSQGEGKAPWLFAPLGPDECPRAQLGQAEAPAVQAQMKCLNDIQRARFVPDVCQTSSLAAVRLPLPSPDGPSPCFGCVLARPPHPPALGNPSTTPGVGCGFPCCPCGVCREVPRLSSSDGQMLSQPPRGLGVRAAHKRPARARSLGLDASGSALGKGSDLGRPLGEGAGRQGHAGPHPSS